MTEASKLHKPRGLAAMTPEKRRAVQSMGGKSSPTKFTSEASIKALNKRWKKDV